MATIRYKTDSGYTAIPAQVVTVTYPPAKLGFGVGTCSTSAETATKTVTITDFELTTNGIISVLFTNAINSENTTLNISNTGSKAIKLNGSALSPGIVKESTVLQLQYDGTDYVIVGSISLEQLIQSSVIAQAISEIYGDIDGIRYNLKNLGECNATCIDFENLPKVCGESIVIEGDGAPSKVPMFIGQRYHDKTNKKAYEAFSVTNSVNDWVLLN